MEIQLWRELLEPYELTVCELVNKFEYLQKGFRIRGEYCPIETVTGRVKTISSILAKAQRKSIPLDRVEEEMYDIAGVRIICQFVEDISAVADLIRNRLDMKVTDERDYVTQSKKSGYRSYHMIICYEVQTLAGPRQVNAEIQIRTLGMNFWATIEHSLQYKYRSRIPEHVNARLIKAAQAIVVLESQISDVRSEIMDAQNSLLTENRLIAEILSTIENLYHIANIREVEKIQNEFYKIYEEGDMERLQRFARELDMIAEGCRAQSVETDEQ